MAELNVSNVFVDGEVVDATRFNTNYSDIVTYVNNRNSGSSTWDAMSSSSTSNVTMTANNSTGTQDIVQFKDNGTSVFTINDGGFVNAPLQDFAYSRYTGVETFSAGSAQKLTNFTVRSQTQSSMNSSGRFTAVASGKYLVMATIAVAVSTSDTIELYIYKNGALAAKRIRSYVTTSPNEQTIIISDVLNLASTDYVEIYMKSTSGQFFVIGFSSPTGSTSSFFYVEKLS